MMSLELVTHVGMLILVILGICWLFQQLFTVRKAVENHTKVIALTEESIPLNRDILEANRQTMAIQSETNGLLRELIVAIRERR
jgi:hypothetical protein